jgi:hypothetical protein
MDWITGDKFKSIADFTFAPKIRANGDYDNLQNTFNLHKLNNNSIIYTHTIYVKELFGILNLFSRGNLIVITHNSDVNVNGSFEVPICIKKWYTTNVDTINSKIESIPIGLENERWFPKLYKKDQMEWRLGQQREYKNLVYMNHDVRTNPSKRQEPYDLLVKNSWVTTDCGKNGQNFAEYINNIYKHKFVICPEGNGIDTHRVWETLYMGSIPIVKKNINYLLYNNDFPICMINSWKDITEEFLLEEFCRVSLEDFSVEKLTFEYWKNKILNEKRN